MLAVTLLQATIVGRALDDRPWAGSINNATAAKCLLPYANHPPGTPGRCCKPGTRDRGFNRPCDSASFAAAHAFCNASLSHEVRLTDLISHMSMSEKVDNLNAASATPSAGLKLYNWWSEGTHGVASGSSVPRTQFAMPITTAQSFNRSLWRAGVRCEVRGVRALLRPLRAPLLAAYILAEIRTQ